MDSKPIKTERDYRAVLKEIEKVMAAEPNTPEGEILIVLVALIEAYEGNHYSLKI